MCAFALDKLVIGRISVEYDPKLFHFTYWGFGWVKPLPEPATTCVFLILAASALVLASGYFYRLSAATTFLLYTYIFLLEKSNYNNHYYLIIVLCFFFVLGEVRGKEGPAWTLDLFRFQFALMYFFAGLAKWNRDWLVGQPLETWLAARAQPMGLPILATPETAVAMSLGGLLLDLLVGPALLYWRTRYVAMFIITGFHLINNALFSIGTFPALMIASNLIFLGKPTRLPGVWAGRRAKFALFFLALQILIPLRHAVIPGNVAWTEDGHRYSWRMKLRSKRALGLRVEVGGKVINPRRYLTRRQLNKMSGRPDMVLQFAHHLSRQADGAKVKIMALLSLNGRLPQSFIDGTVDLSTACQPLLGRTSWIAELREPALRIDAGLPLRCASVLLLLAVTAGLGGAIFHWAREPKSAGWTIWCGSGLLFLAFLYRFYLALSVFWLGVLVIAAIVRWYISGKALDGHWICRLEACVTSPILGIVLSLFWFYG